MAARFRRGLRLVLTLGMLATTAGSAGLALWQSPFTAPMVARSTEAARLSLERAVARTVDAAWLLPRLAEALDEDDLERALMLADLAREHEVALPPPLATRLAEARARHAGWGAYAADCAACALDIAACPSVALIGACGLPLELTPVGDLNALRRAGVAALSGEGVDRIELGLALVGLGASALVVVSGGSSVTLKAGATALRLGRRLGTLSPGFLRVLGEAADLPVTWSRLPDYALGRAPLEAVTDTARLARLGRIAADVGTIWRRTSAADTLLLLRHVDTAEDAARLARLAEAAGPETRRTLAVLGRSRAFRALVRLSDLALATLALLYALALKVLVLAAGLAGSALLRALRRRIKSPVA